MFSIFLFHLRKKFYCVIVDIFYFLLFFSFFLIHSALEKMFMNLNGTITVIMRLWLHFFLSFPFWAHKIMLLKKKKKKQRIFRKHESSHLDN